MIFNVNDVYVGRSLSVYGEWGEVELLQQVVRTVSGRGSRSERRCVYAVLARHVGPAGFVYALELHSYCSSDACGRTE